MSNENATIVPKANFNAEEACITIKKAMKGIGTDEKKVIEVLCGHNNDQRQQIKAQYMTMYGNHLESDLKSELSGLFEATCLELLKPKYIIEAESLRKAMRGNGTDERLLIEIFCTRTSEELKIIKQLYEKLYAGTLDRDLDNELSGDLKRVLRSLANSNRPIDTAVDQAAAKADAQALYDAGEGRFGTDESEFTRILCSKSYAHLIKVFEEYKTISGGVEFLESVKQETSGDLGAAYQTIVKSIINRPAFFAQEIKDAVTGAGTDDLRLIRLIVTRSEIDLELAKVEYQKLYKKSMLDAVSSDLNGDYKKVIAKLIQGNKH